MTDPYVYGTLAQVDQGYLIVHISEAYAAYAEAQVLDYDSDQKYVAIDITGDEEFMNSYGEPITLEDITAHVEDDGRPGIYVDFDLSAYVHGEIERRDEFYFPVVETDEIIVILPQE